MIAVLLTLTVIFDRAPGVWKSMKQTTKSSLSAKSYMCRSITHSGHAGCQKMIAGKQAAFASILSSARLNVRGGSTDRKSNKATRVVMVNAINIAVATRGTQTLTDRLSRIPLNHMLQTTCIIDCGIHVVFFSCQVKVCLCCIVVQK